MPRLADLQKQIKHRPAQRRVNDEEILVADLRGEMRPGDFVEQKLQLALRSHALAQVPSRPTSARAVNPGRRD
jgi:hypothetical protein